LLLAVNTRCQSNMASVNR